MQRAVVGRVGERGAGVVVVLGAWGRGIVHEHQVEALEARGALQETEPALPRERESEPEAAHLRPTPQQTRQTHAVAGPPDRAPHVTVHQEGPQATVAGREGATGLGAQPVRDESPHLTG